MNKKLIIVAPGLAFLAACGGGSTGSVSFQTLSLANHQEGLARGITDTGEEALIYSPQINEFVTAANAANSSDIANVTASDFPVTSINGNVRIRSGTMSSDGITLNVTTVEDLRTTDAAAVFIEMPARFNDISMVTGTAYSNAPSGTYTYNGTQTLTGHQRIAPEIIGNFSMTADFAQENFQYNGSSGRWNVSGSGVLDTVNGRFASSDLVISSESQFSSFSYTADMHGLMHGNGANAVSGIFHTGGSSPITGAFVGSK